MQWRSYRRGAVRLRWKDTHVQILDKDKIQYDGDLSGFHHIEQDGRGYFLYLSEKRLYRLRRGDASPELKAILDSIWTTQNRVGRGI